MIENNPLGLASRVNALCHGPELAEAKGTEPSARIPDWVRFRVSSSHLDRILV